MTRRSDDGVQPQRDRRRQFWDERREILRDVERGMYKPEGDAESWSTHQRLAWETGKRVVYQNEAEAASIHKWAEFMEKREAAGKVLEHPDEIRAAAEAEASAPESTPAESSGETEAKS